MAHRLLLVLIVAALNSSGPISGDASTLDGVRLINADEQTSATAQDVLSLFAEAGLELPALTIEFHSETEACEGHDGLIRYADPVPRLMICSDRRYVLPHELAHAWVHANLTDADKATYVGLWELASWNDRAYDWNDRGTEHAAFTIQQNLMASPQTITQTWAERAEAYEQLTNLRSPILMIGHNDGDDRSSYTMTRIGMRSSNHSESDIS